jgi:hypothetical protein
MSKYKIVYGINIWEGNKKVGEEHFDTESEMKIRLKEL